MKPKLILALLIAGFLGALSTAQAQNYSIDWYKIAGGGGTSTSSTYAVSGTIGQADASGAMTGGNYSLTGGYWSLISVIQTPGAPALHVSQSGGTVTVFWQNVANWSLEQNGKLEVPTGWTTNTSYSFSNGTNLLTLVRPSGNQFFRLQYTGP